MKKLAYILLTCILALTLIEAYSTARADRVTYQQFEENLTGTVSGGITTSPDGWTKITQQIITGIGTGTLPGSPITFIITATLRFKADLGKSYTQGNWTIVASGDQGSISGRLMGTGTSLTQFSGTFKTNNTGTGIYYGKIIYGDFTSQYSEPSGYGAPQTYEATWDGTVKG